MAILSTNTSAVIVPPPPAGSTPAAPGLSVTDTNDIRGLKPPVPVSEGLRWLWWTLALLALVAAAYAAWRRWGQRIVEPPPLPVVPPHVRARLRLENALGHLSDPREFCTRVSAALREYLEERFRFHAPDRTTEEFLLELQDSPHLMPDQKLTLGEFLQRCDLVKFARYEPTEASLRELHETACRLVDETQFEPLSVPGRSPVMSGPDGGATLSSPSTTLP